MQMGRRSSEQRSGPLKVKTGELVKSTFTKTRATLLSCTNNEGDVEKKKNQILSYNLRYCQDINVLHAQETKIVIYCTHP